MTITLCSAWPKQASLSIWASQNQARHTLNPINTAIVLARDQMDYMAQSSGNKDIRQNHWTRFLNGEQQRGCAPSDCGARAVIFASPKSTDRTGLLCPMSWSLTLCCPVPTRICFPSDPGLKATAVFQTRSMSPTLLGFAPFAR